MTIPTGVIDSVFHPQIGLMKRSLSFPTPLFNPYVGSGTLRPTRYAFDNPFLPVTWAYGFRWSVNTAPANAGRRSGAVLTYEDAFFSFALHYLLNDGTDFIGDAARTGLASGFWLFNVSFPNSITYDIDPGWSLHFDWLIAYNQG